MTYFNPFITTFFFIYLCCWPSGAAAQLEIHPYAGYLKAADDNRIELGDGVYVSHAVNRYLAGVDVHVGSRRLAPLFGLVYGRKKVALSAGDLHFNRVWLPLGLAYRLRAADTSFNLVAHGAFVPGVTLVSGKDLERGETEVNYRIRGGLLLYFDFITLGADYYYGFTDGQLEDTASGAFVLRLGGRF